MIGLLEYADINGKKVTRPTSEGEAIGMCLEERVGLYGTYSYTYYNLDAQHFIIDNLEAIVSLDKRDFKVKFNLNNQGKKWSQEDDDKLLALYRSGERVDDIASTLKRSRNSVKGRLRRHGIYDIDLDLSYSADTDAVSVNEYKNNVGDAVKSEADTAEIAEKNAPYEAAASSEIKETLSDGTFPAEDTCYNCKFSRSGECFPKRAICGEYERAYDVPQDEREAWPEMGDASFLRENGRRR